MVRFQTPEGKRGNRVIGVYPDMGIADAHKAADELRQRVRMGEPPEGMYDRRRAEMASKSKEEAEVERLAEEARKHSFTVISDAWLDDRKSGWAPATYDKSVFIVQKRLQPLLGRADMRTLASKDVVPVLVDLATASPSIAVKARQCLNGIVDYCIVRGIRGDDQLLRLQRALPRHRGSHIPAVTKIQGVGPLIRAIQGYEGRVVRGGVAAGRLYSLPARRSGISPLGRDGSRAS